MRIAIDTCVVSELAKQHCDQSVLAWVGTLQSDELVLPAPCWAELQRGLELLPTGRRKLVLGQTLNRLADGMGAILPFDRAAAEHYARLASERGRPRPTFDSMIAAVCLAHDLPLATRNVIDFDGCGIELINPWG